MRPSSVTSERTSRPFVIPGERSEGREPRSPHRTVSNPSHTTLIRP